MDYFRSEGLEGARLHREMEIKAFRIGSGHPPETGSALVPKDFQYAAGMFTVIISTDSLPPDIGHAEWCIFHPDGAETWRGGIVLVEDRDRLDHGRYSLKKYYAPASAASRDTRSVFLLALTGGERTIRFVDQERYQIRGWFVGAVSQIERVNEYIYKHQPAKRV
jgi:hypothetical protein